MNDKIMVKHPSRNPSKPMSALEGRFVIEVGRDWGLDLSIRSLMLERRRIA